MPVNRNVFFRPCSSSSPKCTASATTSSFSMRRATAGCRPPREWRALAARHTGIGFDQALVIEPPRRAGTQAYYRIFNADGGEVEQCGNGVRCLAAFLHRRGALSANGGDGELVLDSPAGLIRARVHDANLISVDMGVPNFDPKSLPFDASAEAHVYPLTVAGTEVEIGAVSMGNPHAVLTVTSVASAPRRPARARHREAPTIPETRERRLHGNRRPRAHPAARLRAWRRGNTGLRHRRMRRCRGRQTPWPPRFDGRSGIAGRQTRNHLGRARRTHLDERADRCIFHGPSRNLDRNRNPGSRQE